MNTSSWLTNSSTQPQKRYYILLQAHTIEYAQANAVTSEAFDKVHNSDGYTSYDQAEMEAMELWNQHGPGFKFKIVTEL